MKRSLLFVAVLTASAFAVAQDTANIRWNPKPDQTLRFRLQVKSAIDIGMGNQDMSMGALITQRTRAVTENEVTVETVQTEFTMAVGGEDLSMMMGDMRITETVRFDRTGRVIERKSDAPAEMGDDNDRQMESVLFIYPNREVKVGDTWSREVTADAKRGVRNARATYKFEGFETVAGKRAWKITFTYAENEGNNPISSTGTVWLDPEDGEMLRGEFTMKNLEFGPGMPPGDASATLTRVN